MDPHIEYGQSFKYVGQFMYKYETEALDYSRFAIYPEYQWEQVILWTQQPHLPTVHSFCMQIAEERWLKGRDTKTACKQRKN